MEILWCTKAPRADIYSQFVSALRTTAGASSADRVGRDPCVPPGQMRCSAAGHMGPALQGAAVIRGGQSRPPLRTLSLRASPRREASALGVQTGAAIRFPSAPPPLDKPVGMGIIVDVRGRCDKRSAPLSENFNEPYGSQKPSLVGVAVFVFQLHNTNRNGIPPDVESKYPVHVCHPLSGL